MAVAKLTSSGKQVQFITDEGYVFGTSVAFLQGLMMGKAKGNFVLLSRMPFNVAADRWKPSPVYDPDGVFQGEAAKTLSTTNDSLSVKSRKKESSKKAFVDKKVW